MKFNINAYYRLARLDKPTGIWLLLIPCWFGLALAQTDKYWLYPIFTFGAIIMRAAGCAINDIADRKLDAKVERTRTRPVASGEISVLGALVFVVILLLMGLSILLLLPLAAIYIGFAITPFVLVYPMMKRITYYPQIMLGIVFNIGVLMGYAAATETLTLAPFILYTGCIFWTLAYDTIYALQDVEDDLKVGIKSTAIKFGKHNRKFIGLFFWAFVLCFAISMLMVKEPDFVSIIFLCLAKLHFSWQVYKLNPAKPNLCWQLFKSNVYVGLLLFFAMIY